VPSYCAYHKILKFAGVLLACDFENIHIYYSPKRRRQSDWWAEEVDLNHSTVPLMNIRLRCPTEMSRVVRKFADDFSFQIQGGKPVIALLYVLWVLMSSF
jgi:hypothetical protein